MDKILVTESQAKVIEGYRRFELQTKIGHLSYIERGTDLDLVTIARIVEGESYEVKHEYKVGDIVLRNGMLYEVLEVNVHLVDDRCKLVCKAENREDLSHD